MIRRIIICLNLMLCFITILSSCSNKPIISVDSSLNFIKETNSQQPDNEDFPEVVDDSRNCIKKVNIVQGNNPVSYKNVEYSEIEITKTKKLPDGIEKEDIDYVNDGLGTKTDEEGTIINNNTYLFIKMKVSNKKNEELMIPMQAMVVELDESLSYNVCKINCIYRSGKSLVETRLKNKKDYYSQYFNAKSSETFTVALIVNDDIINNKNLYLILKEQYTVKELEEPNFQFEEDKAYKIN